MKPILSIILNPGLHTKRINIILLFVRLMIGIFMLTHGLVKFSKLIGEEPIKFADPLNIGVNTSLTLAVFAEFFCSIFLIFGFATRLSGVALLFTMLVAAFISHGGEGF